MIYLDGKWTEDSQAKISVLDLSVLRGFGIFDFLRTYGKNPFMLDAHIDRFFNSARLMGMSLVYSKEEIIKIVEEGIQKSGFEHTNIKLIQTGGVSPDGFTPAEKQTFFIYFYEAHDYPEEMYANGVSLNTSHLMRQNPLAKTINYAASIVEVQKAKKSGAVDILHTDCNGNIYEGTRSNFFAIKNNVLITAEDGILKGITRKAIIEIAQELAIPVAYRLISTSELSSIDEAFVSNSSQEIVPVVKIDETNIGEGTVGQVTQKLIQMFQKKTENVV